MDKIKRSKELLIAIDEICACPKFRNFTISALMDLKNILEDYIETKENMEDDRR